MAELIPSVDERIPLLFIHGSLENGQIFYTQKGKGLAPFLVNKGHRCFVMDQRGRGRSHPPLSGSSSFSQHDYLSFDIPKAIELVKERTGAKKISIVTHSWGGVLVNASLLLNPHLISSIAKISHISVKRRISVINLHRLFYIDLMWTLVGNLFIATKGCLPKNAYGPEGESRHTLKDIQRWVYQRRWIDKARDINYENLAKKHKLPPCLYLTGKKDKCLGHIRDVTDFALESGHTLEDVHLLSKENGHKEDYDHVNILTSKSAPSDHFNWIADFLA